MKLTRALTLRLILSLIAFLCFSEIRAAEIDTLWYKENLNASVLRFSYTGDSVFVYADEKIYIFDTESGNKLHEVKVGPKLAEFELVSNSDFLVAAYKNGSEEFDLVPLIVKWNFVTNDSTVIFKFHYIQGEDWRKSYAASNLSVSRDGKYCTAIFYNNLQDPRTGNRIGDFAVILDMDNLSVYTLLKDFANTYLNSMKFSKKSDTLYYVDRNIKIYDYLNKKISGEFNDIAPFAFRFLNLELNEDNIFTCENTSRKIDIWNIDLRKKVDSISCSDYVYPLLMKYNNLTSDVYLNLERRNYDYMLNIGVYSQTEKDSIGSIDILAKTFEISNFSERICIIDTLGNLIMIRTPDFSTDVNEIQSKHNSFEISPNPANDVIEISIPYDMNKGLQPLVQDMQIRIFNVFGQEVNLTPSLSILGEGDNNPLAPFDKGELRSSSSHYSILNED